MANHILDLNYINTLSILNLDNNNRKSTRSGCNCISRYTKSTF